MSLKEKWKVRRKVLQYLLRISLTQYPNQTASTLQQQREPVCNWTWSSVQPTAQRHCRNTILLDILFHNFEWNCRQVDHLSSLILHFLGATNGELIHQRWIFAMRQCLRDFLTVNKFSLSRTTFVKLPLSQLSELSFYSVPISDTNLDDADRIRWTSDTLACRWWRVYPFSVPCTAFAQCLTVGLLKLGNLSRPSRLSNKQFLLHPHRLRYMADLFAQCSVPTIHFFCRTE